MKLVGRTMSPFVRRVAATLNLYGLSYESLPFRTADQGDEIARYNPLVRVPALELDDGEILVDSSAILDHLDGLAGPDRVLVPPSGAARRAVLRAVAFGLGACEKAVILHYELTRRPADKVWRDHADKLVAQVRGGLGALDSLATKAGSGWLFGERLTQADVTATIALDFADIVLPDIAAGGRFPALAALRDRADAVPAIGETRWRG